MKISSVKIKVVLALCLSVFSFSIAPYAQEQAKRTVAIAPFSTDNEANKKEAHLLREIVMEVFSERRASFDLMNVSYSFPKEDTSYYKNSEAMAKQYRALEIEDIITGNVSEVVFNTTHTGKITVKMATLLFSIQAVEAATGRISLFKNYSITKTIKTELGNSIASDQHNNSIVVSEKDEIRKYVNRFINELYPPHIRIIKMEEKQDYKGLPYSVVWINGGEELGLKKGMAISVNATEIVNGVSFTQQIATLKVNEVKGGFSQCHVSQGLDDLVAKYSDPKNPELEMVID